MSCGLQHIALTPLSPNPPRYPPNKHNLEAMKVCQTPLFSYAALFLASASSGLEHSGARAPKENSLEIRCQHLR